MPTVDSIQRYPALADPSAAELAGLYWSWLDGALGPLVSVRIELQRVTIFLLGLRAILLTLKRPGAYSVDGGLLARPGGHFTFEADEQGSVTSLTGFSPTLPLWLYKPTHGWVHEWTMRRFARFLAQREARIP